MNPTQRWPFYRDMVYMSTNMPLSIHNMSALSHFQRHFRRSLWICPDCHGHYMQFSVDLLKETIYSSMRNKSSPYEWIRILQSAIHKRKSEWELWQAPREEVEDRIRAIAAVAANDRGVMWQHGLNTAYLTIMSPSNITKWILGCLLVMDAVIRQSKENVPSVFSANGSEILKIIEKLQRHNPWDRSAMTRNIERWIHTIGYSKQLEDSLLYKATKAKRNLLQYLSSYKSKEYGFDVYRESWLDPSTRL